MKTTTLLDLHKRSLRWLELINYLDDISFSAENRIKIEDKKPYLESYLVMPKRYFQAQSLRAKIAKERVKRWYLETQSKISQNI